MLRWLFALLTLVLLPVPAYAADTGYRYCRIGDGSALVLRTVRADGSFAFQSSDAPGVLQGGKGGLRAYLAWPTATGAPVLRLAHGTWESRLPFYISGDAELGLTGPDKIEDRTLATTLGKGDFTLFDLDPARLLERFPGAHEIALRVRGHGKWQTLLRAKIDLDSLRAELATVAALAQQPTPVACGAAPAGLTDDRDIAQYTDCRAEMHDEHGGFWAEFDRLVWQYRFPSGVWMEASTLGSWNGPEDLDSRMRAPFGPSSPFTMRIDAGGSGPGYTVTIVVGDRRTVMRSNYFDPVVWADLLQRDVPIVLEVRGPDGMMKRRETLGANWFGAVEKNLIATYARVQEKKHDPMRFCAPPMDIVIT